MLTQIYEIGTPDETRSISNHAWASITSAC